MRNTTAIGDELRDYVVDLLEARGNHVQREIRVNTKKIDVLLVQEDELAQRKIAIEVKNLDRNLSQEELAVIYTSHLSLIQSRHLDELWVIVRRDYSPEAKNWALAQPALHIFNIAEFEERQFGFRRYVRQLIQLFSDQDLDKYYVKQRIGPNESLSDVILTWLESTDDYPVAILGGYGMGKTSFCKYIVSVLGNAYLNDPLKRVPIYIRLSEIAKEQELEGLLGKTLASRYRINNYYFEDIMNLNRRGKFVFIFDGFDEMKHALTWESFKYNFSQINRTVGGNAKVIIAGRPNAFLSDAEHNWALRGTRISGDRVIRLPEWPEYRELGIQPFSSDEEATFLRLYLENHVRKATGEMEAGDKEWIESRINEFAALGRDEDMSRPVHLRIFADLATKRDLALRTFSVFELYEIAAEQTLEREMEKPERLPISAERRGRVIEDVAWWLWEKDSGRTLYFTPAEVPSSIWRQAITTDDYAQKAFSANFSRAHLLSESSARTFSSLIDRSLNSS